MQYRCENCGRVFEFGDSIAFCPYCGEKFDGLSAYGEKSESAVARAIDSIWGGKARLKSEFSDTVSRCVRLINYCAKVGISKAMPYENPSEYAKNYARIKLSNNRKTLIARTDGFIDYLGNLIDNLSYRTSETVSAGLEDTVRCVDKMKGELYGLLGAAREPRSSPRDSCSVEIICSAEQLRELYELVLEAYSKYKRCVEDNNMFAAFSSASDYGVLPDFWLRDTDDEMEEESETEEPARIDDVMENMRERNAKKYLGMPDEDFVPYVDAFWYGVGMLCGFIDNMFSVEYDEGRFFIGGGEKAKLRRIISSKDFVPDESLLDKAVELRERIENRLEDMNGPEGR